jgi:hypothetical protein
MSYQSKNPTQLSSHLAHFRQWLNNQTSSNLTPTKAFHPSNRDKKMAAEWLPSFSDQVDFMHRHGGR